MKFSDVLSFQKAIQKVPPSLVLVIAKEGEEAIESVLKCWKVSPKIFDSESFTAERFSQEVETLPFLTKHVYVHVRELEKLKGEDLEVITSYVKNPNHWVSLLLSSSGLAPNLRLIKAVEESGVVLRLAEAKAWEKERQLAEWLTHEAAAEGVSLTLAAATTLVKAMGNERALLKQELLKLVCFVGKREAIHEADIRAVTAAQPHETFFQLADAVFQRDFTGAWRIGRSLNEEGVTIFPLLASLRTQVRNGLEILTSYERGGGTAVTKLFPYLKGNFLEKKVRTLKGYGKVHLSQALTSIFDAEVEAKNSSHDPQLSLELLLMKLTRQ